MLSCIFFCIIMQIPDIAHGTLFLAKDNKCEEDAEQPAPGRQVPARLAMTVN